MSRITKATHQVYVAVFPDMQIKIDLTMKSKSDVVDNAVVCNDNAMCAVTMQCN